MAKKKSSNKIILIVIVLVVILIGASLVFLKQKSSVVSNPSVNQIKSLPYSDEIQVTTPTQNEKVISPIKITGKAVGSWYFEGTFNAELFDSNNTSLGSVNVNAKGDWMTDTFVPFEGSLEFSSPSTKMGKLVVKKDNPSGLPENDKKIEIPVDF